MQKILIIDDSSFSRNTIKKILGNNYHFIEANSGEMGLEVYAQEKPNLVILDLTMPGMDGIEMLERLLLIDPDAKVIIGSADIQDYNRQRTKELGALAFINKPFDKDSFPHVIENALKGNSAGWQ